MGARTLVLASDPVSVDFRIDPTFTPGRGRRLEVRSVEHDEDRRSAFTLPGSLRSLQTTVTGASVDAHLDVGPVVP